MREDELVLGVAVLEGLLEPVVLLLSQRPAPLVTRHRVVVLLPGGRCVRKVHRVLERVDDHEERVAPRPGVVVLAKLVAVGPRVECRQRIGVAAVEPVVGRESGSRACARWMLATRGAVRRVVEVPALFVLVVAGGQEERDRGADLVEVGRIPVGSGSRCWPPLWLEVPSIMNVSPRSMSKSGLSRSGCWSSRSTGSCPTSRVHPDVTVNEKDSPAALCVRKVCSGPRLEVPVRDASVGVIHHAVVVERVGTQTRDRDFARLAAGRRYVADVCWVYEPEVVPYS